jgi:hypothetical protein
MADRICSPSPSALPPTLARNPPPCSIQQKVPHNLSRYREKVGAVLPIHICNVDQFQVSLVDQGRRLHGVARALVLHAPCGDPAQLVVNSRRELR